MNKFISKFKATDMLGDGIRIMINGFMAVKSTYGDYTKELKS